MELPNLVSLEEALKRETIGDLTFYHPFKFTRKNRNQIYELVEKLKKLYREDYEPEDNARKYYERHFNEIDEAKSGKLKEQKEAIRGLLTAIVLD